MSKNKHLTVALAGNPNSGKSTLFNNLTGARQHIGNYPGVTVEKKEGILTHKDYTITIVDLPGTYGLSANSEDERVSRQFLMDERPDIIVHVIDASNIERHLYLFTHLIELNIPIILALNMSDIAEERGLIINTEELSKLLGSPVIQTIGNKNQGTTTLIKTLIDRHEGRLTNEPVHVDYGEEVRAEINNLYQLLQKEHHPHIQTFPTFALAVKLLEGDTDALAFIETYTFKNEILAQLDKSKNHLRQHFGDDTQSLIADRRYGFASGACAQTIKTTTRHRQDFSDQIDKIILHPLLGIPVFVLVMFTIFEFTFTFSAPFVHLFESFFEWLTHTTALILPAGLIRSFLADGIIGGVGGVLGFFPLVLFMFFAIAFFEDSGYMARAAFIMDRFMNRFGLHGKSFLPMMISTNGCAVPGLLATRALEDKRDRLITMMITPFMICGAKLPIFALFIGAFFPVQNGASLMLLMYVLSIILAFGCAWILKKFILKGEITHFVMELPPYRMPTLKGLLLKMWERGWLYLKKAGTIILLLSIIIWGGFTFPQIETAKYPDLTPAEFSMQQLQKSYAGTLGRVIEPAVKPLGLDWRSGIALVSGIAAKEIVVSTFGTIYSLDNVNPEETDSLKTALQKDPSWNPLNAFVFLIFCLIYLPCLSTVAIFFNESGNSIKWTAFLIIWTTSMAWVVSFLVFQIGTLFKLGI